MPVASITVQTTWDDEAEVWVTSSDDIDGLAVEASTWAALAPKVLAALDDIIELNEIQSDLTDISVRLVTEFTLHIPNPAAGQSIRPQRLHKCN